MQRLLLTLVIRVWALPAPAAAVSITGAIHTLGNCSIVPPLWYEDSANAEELPESSLEVKEALLALFEG